MKRIRGFTGLLALLVHAVFTGGAWAHALWLEPLPEGKLALRFGEYDNNLREPSEKLARLGPLQGQIQNNQTVKETSLGSLPDGFSLSPVPADASALFRAEKIPVRDPREGRAPSRSLWFGRWIPSSWKTQKPVLPLDMVPSSKGTLQLFSKGNPLPNAAVKFLSANAEKGELLSNGKGLVDLRNLKPGFYLLTVQTQEKQAGTFEGKAYENVNTRLTLSFTLP